MHPNVINVMEEANAVGKFFEQYEEKTISGIVVESLQEMANGITGSIKAAFDGLVLNEAGTGLSALAIWTLAFLGLGFVWKIIPIGLRFL